MSQFIALDLGAESGRAIVGQLEENRLNLALFFSEIS